jgi:hypothetical protein
LNEDVRGQGFIEEIRIEVPITLFFEGIGEA